ncbi:Bacterial membrane flanked domain protein [Corynebacterium glaucum]|uniref:Bacterial membrane flanked domain protein n=1 Tax=Corynebacterium glaucum TaxID=187491 RepID=A0A1Q2HUF2_9CORY|nr:PH domain-containing protein [Corynebacterium glaucum]AQQ14469.1 Bacterial membrane flanked domain protein [Corynebacterium glaucum]
MTPPAEPAQPDQPAQTAQYRRVHRLSPVLQVWATLLALLTLLVFNFATPLLNWVREEALGSAQLLWPVVAVVVALIVVVGVSQLWWSKTGFRVGAEEIEHKRGVLHNQVRTARYDRIQAVDVVEPLAPRLFGLAGVRIEVAGGVNAAIDISYLPREEAEELRAEILTRIAAKGPNAAMAEAAAEELAAGEELAAEELQEREPGGLRADGSSSAGPPNHRQDFLVPPIPIGRSMVAALFQLSTIATVAASLVPLLTDLTLAAIVPILVGFMPLIWRTIDQSWRFNASFDGEVFKLRYGLANRRRQAVPHERIHAVQLKQPLLWRPFGWWTVSITSAGFGAEASAATGTAKLLPVGTYDEAVAVVGAVGPLGAEALTDLSRADYASPRRARWVSPLDWKRQTVTVRDGVALTSFGRLTGRYQMVKTPHIQELSFEQGPLERKLGLASVRFDLVPGLVKMTARDLDDADARALLEALRARHLPPMRDEMADLPA